MLSHPVLRIAASTAKLPLDVAPFHEWKTPDGAIWTGFYRMENSYLIRFPDLADFRVSFDGREVMAYPAPGISQHTINHLYLNQVLPLALGRQFKLVLHASAVEVGDGALAFLGASGRGKSTLAASFATSGFGFLTDDGLQLERTESGYVIRPSHPSIRLWDDSSLALMPESIVLAPPVEYTPKSRFLAGGDVLFCDTPRPLRGVYFLGEGKTDKVSIEPIGGRDAMVELVKHSFLLDIEAREMLAHHFAQLTDMVKTRMFFLLDYPRQYEMLSKVREALVNHVREQR